MSAPVQRLHRAHFAFMRALLQGMDERQSWDRYLRVEGESTDLRTVRRTIAWIRDEFATAARRAARPGTARLILIDPERLEAVPSLPTLEEFAAQRGLEDFSFAEQAQAYAEAHPTASASRRRPNRRVRVVERQLAALRWLEAQVGRDPQPDDAVDAWITPAVAWRLMGAGLHTLRDLVAHINAEGARWWRHVPGVGEGKATRVVQWLLAQPATPDWRVGDHASAARTQIAPAVFDAVVLPSMAVVPLEKLRLPPELDGRAGSLRAPASECRLPAADDLQAISAWLDVKGGRRGDIRPSSTHRAYRKEAERLLLWAVLVRGKALSSLTPEDVEQYAEFLSSPPVDWCGPRHHQRWSPRWRPLEGPISANGQRHAWAVLDGLFKFLVVNRYLKSNPFARAHLPALQGQILKPVQALTSAQWTWLEPQLNELRGSSGRRFARALKWLHATGLRPGELTAARCADLISPVAASGLNDSMGDWTLLVAKARGSQRRLAVPKSLIDELHADLVLHGFAEGLSTPGAGEVPILARYDAGAVQGWTASGLAKAIKAWMHRLSEDLEEKDATALRLASAKWFGNTLSAPTVTPLRQAQGSIGSATAVELHA